MAQLSSEHFRLSQRRSSRRHNLNLGLLDHRAAVEWLHNNIAAFGGKPGRMILWG